MKDERFDNKKTVTSHFFDLMCNPKNAKTKKHLEDTFPGILKELYFSRIFLPGKKMNGVFFKKLNRTKLIDQFGWIRE